MSHDVVASRRDFCTTYIHNPGPTSFSVSAFSILPFISTLQSRLESVDYRSGNLEFFRLVPLFFSLRPRNLLDPQINFLTPSTPPLPPPRNQKARSAKYHPSQSSHSQHPSTPPTAENVYSHSLPLAPSLSPSSQFPHYERSCPTLRKEIELN